jgi:hypothetical protein
VTARRLTFWGGVAGVSLLSMYGLGLLTAKFPSSGIAKFAAVAQGAS